MEHRVVVAEQDLKGGVVIPAPPNPQAGLSKRQWELSVQIWRQEVRDQFHECGFWEA